MFNSDLNKNMKLFWIYIIELSVSMATTSKKHMSYTI